MDELRVGTVCLEAACSSLKSRGHIRTPGRTQWQLETSNVSPCQFQRASFTAHTLCWFLLFSFTSPKFCKQIFLALLFLLSLRLFVSLPAVHGLEIREDALSILVSYQIHDTHLYCQKSPLYLWEHCCYALDI